MPTKCSRSYAFVIKLMVCDDADRKTVDSLFIALNVFETRVESEVVGKRPPKTNKIYNLTLFIVSKLQ